MGPGSSPEDYAAVGLDFSERWPRFDEAIGAVRALWRPDGAPFVGRFYSTEGLSLEPLPAQLHGPPIWVGSWGSDAGLRRVAVWPTAGWRLPTTRRPSCSAQRG